MFGSSRNNYNGNPNLKAIGVNVQYTIEQIQELKRCKSDPLYFIENYCKVVSLDNGLVAFNTYDYQKKFISTIHENRFTIGMMPRQMGKCFCLNTKVRIRNKKNPDEIIELPVGAFYEWQKFKKYIEEVYSL